MGAGCCSPRLCRYRFILYCSATVLFLYRVMMLPACYLTVAASIWIRANVLSLLPSQPVLGRVVIISVLLPVLSCSRSLVIHWVRLSVLPPSQRGTCGGWYSLYIFFLPVSSIGRSGFRCGHVLLGLVCVVSIEVCYVVDCPWKLWYYLEIYVFLDVLTRWWTLMHPPHGLLPLSSVDG